MWLLTKSIPPSKYLNMKNLLLLTLLYFATLSAAQAQPYYWIGFGDNWSTTTAWSTSPGGADCGCVPDDADDVIFDGNSGDCVIDVELSGRTGAFTMEAGYGGVITLMHRHIPGM